MVVSDLAAARKQHLQSGWLAGPIRRTSRDLLIFDSTHIEKRAIRVGMQFGPEPPEPIHEVEVRAALDAYLDAFNRGDWAEAAKIYADDARFHWSDEGLGTTYFSRAEVLASTESAYAALSSHHLELSNTRVEVLSPHLALFECDYEQEMTFSPGSKIEFGGRISVLLEKIDGRWQYLAGHSSGVRSPAGR